jgi:hypothetical protein
MPDAVNRLSTFLTFDDEKSKFAPLLRLLELKCNHFSMFQLEKLSLLKMSR